MRTTEAAKYTGLSESTLAKLRMRHKRDSGPTYIKRGGSVIYRSSDLDNWMDQQVVD
jgi:predicted DNA-binding transcriptional regulator AlpA